MTHDKFDEYKSVSDEAVVWFTRLQSGDATEDTRRQFEVWRARSPIHAREFDKISALWNDLDSLKTWADQELTKRKSISGIPAYSQNRMRKRGASRRRSFVGGVLLTLLIGGFWLPNVWVQLASDYHTETGEQKTLNLVDGSMVYLDTSSALSVDSSPQIRRLALDEGRALFVVAEDKRRPFEVAAAGGTVRALGTEFEVYKKSDQVTVTVLKGTVEVSRDDSAVRLVPGQQIHYGPNITLSEVEAIDSEQIAAWRRGKLVFNDQPLGKVIEEVNRYRNGAIFILDQQLRTSRVSGIFDTGNPDAALQTLEDILPIRMRRLTPYLILLDRS